MKTERGFCVAAVQTLQQAVHHSMVGSRTRLVNAPVAPLRISKVFAASKFQIFYLHYDLKTKLKGLLKQQTILGFIDLIRIGTYLVKVAAK